MERSLAAENKRREGRRLDSVAQEKKILDNGGGSGPWAFNRG